MRTFYITKVTINKYRSIDYLSLKNIGDITIFVGPNESGKSNILLALKWFGSDDPLDKEIDIPVNGDVRDDEAIVEVYLKVLENSRFWGLLEARVREELKTIFGMKFKVNLTELKKKLEKSLDHQLYLKFQKFHDGSFQASVLDYESKNLNDKIAPHLKENVMKNIDLVSLFDKCFEDGLRATLPQDRNIPETQIRSWINLVKNHPSFSNAYKAVVEKLNTIKINETTDALIKTLNREILPLITTAPSVNQNFSVGGVTVTLNPNTEFKKAYEKLKSRMQIDFKELLQKILKELRPKFVYLSEEMELKGSVKIEELGDDTSEYIINYRLFKVLGIDNEFRRKNLQQQNITLRNRLNSFSNRLKELWKQQRIRIVPVATETEVLLQIEEVDEHNNPIKTTSPEMRSRGFKWYLAYFITLEFMKNEENAVLLMDDPAVFLHEKGQKDFLKIVEDTSKNIQIFYNTHLISLFDARELDRVLLVKLDRGNNTTVKRPWTNKIEEVAAPVYHALGFDKLIFERVKKVLFVEGISDKFILEGLQCLHKGLSEWYIHPLSGGDKLEDHDLIKRLDILTCLSNYGEIEYRFVLDGDRKRVVEEKSRENPNIKNKTILLGEETEELEDLFERDFYLQYVLGCCKDIFLGEPERFKTVKQIVENIRKQPPENKISKAINAEFRKAGLGKFLEV